MRESSRDLESLFSPGSVAVIGASRDPAKVGHRVFQGLLRSGFQGTVYPVNPNARQVGSVKAYPSVAAIEERVEMAVVAVPASSVLEVVEGCGEAGVKSLVVLSGGFAEIGEEGRRRQSQLVEATKESDLCLLGPNCLGLLNTHPRVRLNASFAPLLPEYGPVALCSQSGALGIALLSLAVELDLGLGRFVSVGNKADVAADDILNHWGEDPESQILLFYQESFKTPRRFGTLAREISREKPIIVVKGGKSEAGERAAGSHTASLVGEDEAVEAFFRQTGIIRGETLQDMFGMARALSLQPLPPGPRFAVITNAGGPGILCADSLEAEGLSVAPLKEATQKRLKKLLPEEASVVNPVDMIASAGIREYRETVKMVLAADEVDGVVVIHTPVGVDEVGKIQEAVLQGMAEARSDEPVASEKPVYASIVGGRELIYLLRKEDKDRSEERIGNQGDGERDRVGDSSWKPGGSSIPAFPFPEEIARVAGPLARHREWRDAGPHDFPSFPDQDLERARNLCRQALEDRGEGWLSVEETRELLSRADLPVSPGGVVDTTDDAVGLAVKIGFPVALKLASSTIVHKTEMEAVKLDLKDEEAVRSAFHEIREALEEEDREDEMEGVLVQPHLCCAAEVMMGMKEDPVFGPLLAFGLGGIHVEVLRDVAFGLAPLSRRDAQRMIQDIRGHRLLEGYRGHPAADMASLEEALLRTSRLVEEVREIAEMDLNPVMALNPGEGSRIVDARVRVRER